MEYNGSALDGLYCLCLVLVEKNGRPQKLRGINGCMKLLCAQLANFVAGICVASDCVRM